MVGSQHGMMRTPAFLFVPRVARSGCAHAGYCQLNATLGLFSLGSGEEGAFLESFFAKNHQKTAQKSAQWGKLIKGIF